LEIAIGAISADADAGLKETVRAVTDGVPAVAVEGDAEKELGGWNGGGFVGENTALYGAALAFGTVERSEEAGGLGPGAAVVVVHDADLIDEAANGGHVDAGVHAG